MFRVYQRFEAIGDPLSRTFNERNEAEAYAEELRREIAEMEEEVLTVALGIGGMDSEGASDPEWSRVVGDAVFHAARCGALRIAQAAVVIEEE